MKKRIFLGLLLSVILTVISSCAYKAKEVEKQAVEFLDAYFKVEYARAAEYCTDELKADIIKTMESIESLEPGIKEMIIQNTSQSKVEITSVDTQSKKDTAIVAYKVILPNFPNGIENRLTLVKRDKSWKICDLGQ